MGHQTTIFSKKRARNFGNLEIMGEKFVVLKKKNI
jgi:hypothetical protein